MSNQMTVNQIVHKIHVIRGIKVMLDNDLAFLYRVPTKVLTRAVKRNLNRFPDDFLIRLTEEEAEILRCQIGASSWGGRRYLPFGFTEQGVAMLSSVLRSQRAVTVNVSIMRAFVRMRGILATHKELAQKIEGVELKLKKQERRSTKQSKEIQSIIRTIRGLIDSMVTKDRIGFKCAA